MPYVDLQRCTHQRFFKADMSLSSHGHGNQQAMGRSTNDADILRVIGFLQLQHGKFEQAVVLFDALHALFPEDLTIALSLAFALLQAGQAHDASEVLKQIETFAVFSSGLSSLQRNSCFCWLRSLALAEAGQAVEAARWMRFFLRSRRQSNVEAAS